MSESLDSALAARFRESMPRQPEGACPPPEVLWSAARGELPSSELEALTSHLRSCALCGEALAVSADLTAESEPRAIFSSVSRRRQLGVAAAGITALAAGLLVVLWPRGSSPVERPGAAVVVASRGEASDRAAIRVASRGEQPVADVRLEWTPVERAVRYRVRVSTEDLQPLYDRTVEQGTTLRVPPAVAERAPWPGVGPRLLHWQVEAMLPDGRMVTSPTFTLQVVPSPASAP